MPEREFQKLEITVVRGVEWSEEFVVQDAAGAAVNLAGHAIEASIRATRALDGALVAAFTLEMLDEAAGRFRIFLSEAATSSLTASAEAGWFFLHYSGPTTGYRKLPMFSGRARVQ